MSIWTAYLILSFIFSSFVLAACMLSSRLSQREGLKEVYVTIETHYPATQPAAQSN